MKKYNSIKSLFSVLIFLAVSNILVVSAEEEIIHAPAAIQISSTVSDGKYSIPEIVKIAKQNGVKIVVLTDQDCSKWEYGLWPLRRVMKRTEKANSISTYGIKQYLKEIEEVQKRNPDLVIIPGVESAPFYSWVGNPLKGTLTMYDWHKHMLVVGLEARGYKNLPTVSNGYSLLLPFRLKDVYRLWPILILILGILCLKKREFDYKDLNGHQLGPYSQRWRKLGIFIIVISLFFILNNFPFREFKYDQYHGEKGIGPYQNFIDYVNQRGGLTFWSHPEAEYIEDLGIINAETRKHADDLLYARNYTGFAVFYEGYELVGRPGGIWDKILKEYCKGLRESPIWTIGGLAFAQGGENLGWRMKNLRTILLIPRLTKETVLQALREGRMYVVQGKEDLEFILDEFFVKDSASDAKGIMGDEIGSKGKPLIKIKGHFLGEEVESVTVQLIRGGIVIETFKVMNPFEIEYQDDYFSDGEKIYYRIEIRAPSEIIISNPIFVKFTL